MPSPEHGASTMTASKTCGHFAARSAVSALVTMALVMPMRSTLPASTCALFLTYSLAISSPCPSMAKAIWVVFPPGAAQASSTVSPRLASNTAAGSMALGS